MDEREMMVWSRLRTPGQEPGCPEALLREAEDLAEEYRRLGLGEMYRGARQAVRVLRGIGILEGSRMAPGRRRPGISGDRRRRLTQCYHRARRLMAEYAARTAQPETGFLYQHLEGQEHRRCIQLARLLGEL